MNIYGVSHRSSLFIYKLERKKDEIVWSLDGIVGLKDLHHFQTLNPGLFYRLKKDRVYGADPYPFHDEDLNEKI